MRTLSGSCRVASERTQRLPLNVVISAWLDSLSEQTLAQYAREKSPEKRRLQTGAAWRDLARLTATESDLEMAKLFCCLMRFAGSERNRPARLLGCAFLPLALEHEACGCFIGSAFGDDILRPGEGLCWIRRSVRRWCDWVESLAHWQVHRTLQIRAGPASGLEEGMILLWPLARHDHWTLRDLFSVLGLALRRPLRSLCSSDREFFERVRRVGLRATDKRPARPAIDRLPATCAVALRYAKFWPLDLE